MSSQGSESAIAVLTFGGGVLLVSVLVARLVGRRGGGAATATRAVATGLASLICVGFLLPNPHGPLLYDVVLLAALYPLIACEVGQGLVRRSFFLTAAAAQTIVLVVDLGQWRYGFALGQGAAWGVGLLVLAPIVAAVLMLRLPSIAPHRAASRASHSRSVV